MIIDGLEELKSKLAADGKSVDKATLVKVVDDLALRNDAAHTLSVLGSRFRWPSGSSGQLSQQLREIYDGTASDLSPGQLAMRENDTTCRR